MNTKSMTLESCLSLLEKREASPKDLTEAYLGEIHKQNSSLGAFITVSTDGALRAAEILRKDIADRKIPLIAGVPYAVKDNLSTKGLRTTCGSKMLADYIPPYSAEVLERLGGPILGKTSMDEFGMGSTGESCAFCLCKNPCNPSLSPGGSSGGSAAAVAAGLAPFALGTDTGGSVRQPAALSGIVGLKPTYGRISRYGLISFASSLDTVGTLTKNVRDAAILLSTISGKDKKDHTSSNRPVNDYLSEIENGVKGLKIALLANLSNEASAPRIHDNLLLTAKKLADAGAYVCEENLPSLEYALSAYYIISSAEASSNLARYDGVRYGIRGECSENAEGICRASRKEGFGAEVKRRIMLGTFVLSSGHYDEYYKRAVGAKERIRAEMCALLERYDLILLPTTPNASLKLREKRSPSQIYREDIFTIPASLGGLPAISIPSGYDEKGIPLGIQMIAAEYDEMTLLRAAREIEKEEGNV